MALGWFHEVDELRARCRADLEEVAKAERAAGLTTPTNDEVQELLGELLTAERGLPVIPGCEGDG